MQASNNNTINHKATAAQPTPTRTTDDNGTVTSAGVREGTIPSVAPAAEGVSTSLPVPASRSVGGGGGFSAQQLEAALKDAARELEQSTSMTLRQRLLQQQEEEDALNAYNDHHDFGRTPPTPSSTPSPPSYSVGGGGNTMEGPSASVVGAGSAVMGGTSSSSLSLSLSDTAAASHSPLTRRLRALRDAIHYIFPTLSMSSAFIILWTCWTALLAALGWLEASVFVFIWATFVVLLGLIWLSSVRDEVRELYVAKFSAWYANLEQQAMLSYVIGVLFGLRVLWALGLLLSLEVIVFAVAVLYVVRSNTRADEQKRLMALNILAGSAIRPTGGGVGGSSSAGSPLLGGSRGGRGAGEIRVDAAADAELLRRVLGTELPPWVNFPNIARGDFFNVLLKGMWPYMSEALDNSTRSMLDSLLSVYKPAAFSKLEMGIIRFGTIPIVVHGVESASVGNNSYMDLHISWAGDSDLRLVAKLTMPPSEFEVQLRQVKLRGVLRIEFGNHIRQWPCFSTYSFSFVTPPSLTFDLNFARMSANAIPFAKGYFEDLIRYFINLWLVHPNRLKYAAINNPEETSTRADAHGLLYLRLRSVEGHRDKCLVKINLIGEDVIHKSTTATPHQVAAGGAASTAGSSTATSANAKTKGYVAEFDDYFQLVVSEKGQLLKFALHDSDALAKMSGKAAIATATDFIKQFADRSGNDIGRVITFRRRDVDVQNTSDAAGGKGGAAGGGGRDLILRYDAQFFAFLSLEEGTLYWQATQGAKVGLGVHPAMGAEASSPAGDAAKGAGGGGGTAASTKAGGASPMTAPLSASGASGQSPLDPMLGGSPPTSGKATAVTSDTVYFSQGSDKVKASAVAVGGTPSSRPLTSAAKPSSGGGPASFLSNLLGVGDKNGSDKSGATERGAADGVAGGGAHASHYTKRHNARKPLPLAVVFININRCQNLLEGSEAGARSAKRSEPDPFVRAKFTSLLPGCDQSKDTHTVKQNRHPSFWTPAAFTVYSWEDSLSFEAFDDVDSSSIILKAGAKSIGKLPPITLAEVAVNGCFLKETRPFETDADISAGTITFEVTLRIIDRR